MLSEKAAPTPMPPTAYSPIKTSALSYDYRRVRTHFKRFTSCELASEQNRCKIMSTINECVERRYLCVSTASSLNTD